MMQIVTVNEDHGSIELIDFLPPPNYYVGEVVARSEKSSLETSARLTISVSLENLCPGERPTNVAHTLVVKHLDEETEHKDIFDTVLEKCKYVIESQLPEETGELCSKGL